MELKIDGASVGYEGQNPLIRDFVDSRDDGELASNASLMSELGITLYACKTAIKFFPDNTITISSGKRVWGNAATIEYAKTLEKV